MSRPATPADARAIAQLVVACDESHAAWVGDGFELPPCTFEHEWGIWMGTLGSFTGWTRVIEEDGTIVAVARWAPGRHPHPGGELVPGLAHVSAVFVHPSAWRRGVASQLLAEAEDAARAEGYVRFRLFTLEGSPAEHLYRSLGWEPTGERDHYHLLDLPVVGYAKEL